VFGIVQSKNNSTNNNIDLTEGHTVSNERIKTRADWVYEGLLGWLRGVYGLQGLHLNEPQVYRNARPSQAIQTRVDHHWLILGVQIWERAEISLYQGAGPQHLNWTNVREFQRDITTWVKVWHDCVYHPPGCAQPVRMSSMIDMLVNALHACSGMVEVATEDLSAELVGIWIRLKQYPDHYAMMASIPKHSSVAALDW
jgi:hypothetical protein